MSKEKFYLRAGLEDLGITSTRLMEDLNVSQPFISGLLNGKKAIGGSIAVKLYELYSINPYWTLTGKGEVTNNNKKVINKKPAIETNEDEKNNDIDIKQELIDIKSELNKQMKQQQKHTSQIIDYIDEYLKPVFDFMQETMENKKKENT